MKKYWFVIAILFLFACKKDIAPFLEDLKNIYDIDITHEEITWENPDKIQTQKYQYVNKNKGTN